MEIEVWAEKYRPKKLNEVINQKHVVERLKAFVKEKNIPNLLFAGPAGTGKTTCALCIARELYGKNWRANVLSLNASVTPETPLLIRENGRIERTTIGELAERYFKGEEKYAYPKDLEVLSVTKDFEVKFLPVSNLSRHKKKEVIRIKYEGGEIRTTLDHSVIVLNEDFELCAKKASELREGDLLISFVTRIEGDLKKISLQEFKPNEFVLLKSGPVRIKVNSIDTLELTKETAWMLGSFTAEGCAYPRGGITVFTYAYPQEMRVVKRVQEIMRGLGFSPSTHLIRSGSSGKLSAIQLTVCSTQFTRFLRKYFYDGKTKRIPPFIFSLPVSLRIEFLKGYAGDACGEWGDYLRYSSSSRDLLIDMAWLARISGLDTSVFEEEARIRWKGGTYDFKDLICAQPIISFFERIERAIGINWRYLLRHQLYSKKSRRVKRSVVKEIIEAIDREKLSKEERVLLERLEKLVDSDLYWVRIRKIEKMEYDGWVYDLSVPGSEVFFGGSVPILLHNSDARGIDVIRGRVKDFARTKPIGEIPFKIIIMDESDAMTPDAQQALRRTMEDFANVTRFILICNYSSKIIDPIQSRCAVFRFRALSDKDVRKFIDRIVKNEKLKISEDGIKAIIEIAEGDLRKVANLLQACASLATKITEDVVYDVASRAKPGDVKEMLELALKGNFLKARKKLHELLLKQGLAGSDIITEIHRQIYNLPLEEEDKVKLIEKCGDIEFRISEGGNELIQLEALLAYFLLFSKRKK